MAKLTKKHVELQITKQIEKNDNITAGNLSSSSLQHRSEKTKCLKVIGDIFNAKINK